MDMVEQLQAMGDFFSTGGGFVGNETALILIGSLVIVSFAFAFSVMIKSREIRNSAILLFAALTYLLAGEYSSTAHEFMLSLTIEFIGAVLALVILRDWLGNPWLTLLLAGVICLGVPSLLILTNAEQSFSFGMLAEFVGALTLFILIDREAEQGGTSYLLLRRWRDQVKAELLKLRLENGSLSTECIDLSCRIMELEDEIKRLRASANRPAATRDLNDRPRAASFPPTAPTATQ